MQRHRIVTFRIGGPQLDRKASVCLVLYCRTQAGEREANLPTTCVGTVKVTVAQRQRALVATNVQAVREPTCHTMTVNLSEPAVQMRSTPASSHRRLLHVRDDVAVKADILSAWRNLQDNGWTSPTAKSYETISLLSLTRWSLLRYFITFLLAFFFRAALLLLPPAATWTRSRQPFVAEQKPLRSRQHQLGCPDFDSHELPLVGKANRDLLITSWVAEQSLPCTSARRQSLHDFPRGRSTARRGIPAAED